MQLAAAIRYLFNRHFHFIFIFYFIFYFILLEERELDVQLAEAIRYASTFESHAGI